MNQSHHKALLQAIAWLGFWLVAANSATGAEPGSSELLESLFSGSSIETDKVILVLHQGRPGNSMATGSRLNMYRSRGYGNDTTWNRRAARTIADRHSLSYLTDWWMSEIDVNCAVFRIQNGKSVTEVLSDLLNDPEVVAAQKLEVFSALGTMHNDPYFELQSSAKYFDLAAVHAKSTGKGIYIAVVDTGIETLHQELDGQITRSSNFAEQISPGYLDDIHGTAVAGVIAAHANNNAGIVGFAPDAKIIGLKACWPVEEGKLAAVCNSFTLALALNNAISAGVNIINLSLFGPPDTIVEMLIQKALHAGIVIIAATQDQEGTATNTFPASIPGVIAVTDSEPDIWRGAGQPVFAPSTNVLTTVPNNSYNFVSGTSLGAAQITGYVALLLQESPGLESAEIHKHLIEINNSYLEQSSVVTDSHTAY